MDRLEGTWIYRDCWRPFVVQRLLHSVKGTGPSRVDDINHTSCTKTYLPGKTKINETGYEENIVFVRGLREKFQHEVSRDAVYLEGGQRGRMGQAFPESLAGNGQRDGQVLEEGARSQEEWDEGDVRRRNGHALVEV